MLFVHLQCNQREITTDKARCREKKGPTTDKIQNKMVSFKIIIKVWKVKMITIKVKFF